MFVFKCDSLKRCLDFLKEGKLPDAGSLVEIGDGIRCIVNQYETAKEEEAIWEAHQKYIDLHYVLSGEEQIGVAPIGKCETGTYFVDQDYLEVKAVPTDESILRILLKPGAVLCLSPDDAHQVGVQAEAGKNSNVTKVVFKIPIELTDSDNWDKEEY